MTDHVGVSNQGLVWVGIMSPQDLQEREMSEQRSRQPSSPGLLSYLRAFRTRTDCKGWVHLPWLCGSTRLKNPPCGSVERVLPVHTVLWGGVDHMPHQAQLLWTHPLLCDLDKSLPFSVYASSPNNISFSW